jgi:xanthine dehydrogenase molybdenum-binding subunit
MTASSLGVAKVTGAGKYPGDYSVDGCLFGAVVRSTVPHATVCVTNISELRALDGVRAVIKRTQMNLDDRVRQIGDVILGVVADDEAVACRAVALAKVDYLPLPTVVEAREAESCGVLIDDAFPSNVVRSVERAHGDVEAALERSVIRHRGRYQTGRPMHFNLSRRCCVVTWNADGDIDVLTSADAPFFARKELAAHVGVPEESITLRVSELPTSSFGGRTSVNPLFEPVAVAMAKAVPGTPVCLRLAASEELTVNQTRHPIEFDIDAGLDSDGRLVALDMSALVDHGAYPSFVTDVVLANCRDRALDVFAVDNYRFRGKAVLTNNVTAGEMRGIGVTQVMWAVGCHLDELARLSGREPIDFIRANLAAQTAMREEPPSYRARTSLTKSLALGAERAAAAASSATGPTRIGWGVAVGLHTTGLGTFHGGDRSAATVTLHPDGRIVLKVAAPDSGQGAASAYVRMLANALEVESDTISVAPVDTASSPYDRWGSVASRGVFVVGAAVLDAARALKDQLRELASTEVTVREVVSSLPEPITAHGTSHQQENPPTYGACFAQVEVDDTSGVARLRRVVSVVDVGHAIDPESCHAQLAGAVATGWEFALGAELSLVNGHPSTSDPHDHRFAHFEDLPLVETILVEEPEPAGPLGARGIGTPAVAAVAPAICNAIRSAIGYRPATVPVRGDELLRHIVETESAGVAS